MKRKSNKGITLISLVITIIIMLILAGVVITLALGNNGLIGKAKEAKEETNKQTAIEQINLKITNSITKKYAEEQRDPTLQELANDFCEDNEIEYVELTSKKLASVDKIEIGKNKSFFTKLKKYPYEFEINSSFGLTSINGEKIETEETNNLGKDYNTNLKYKLNLSEDLSSQSGITINGSGVTLSNDKKYISFDGTSYININNDTVDPTFTLRNQSDVTMCAWYRTSKISGEQIIISLGEKEIEYVYNNHYLMFSSDTLIGAGQGCATITSYLPITNRADGNWHFIVGIWSNNNTLDFYYDGVPFKATGTYQTSNSFINIGGSMHGRNFVGDISGVRIYDKALTEDEVKIIYEYGKKCLGI